MTSRHLPQKPAVFAERRVAPGPAFSIARLVREDATYADPVERGLDLVERPLDRSGRRVEIDDTRCACLRRHRRSGEGRRVHELVIERLVERPPYQLELVGHRARCLRRRWHSARERHVEVGVADCERRRDDAAAHVDPGRSLGHRPADLREHRAAHEHVGQSDPRRMQLDECASGEDDRVLVEGGELVRTEARSRRTERALRREDHNAKYSYPGAMAVDLIVRGERVFTPAGERPAAVHIDTVRGTIVAITDLEAAPVGVPTLDAGRMCLLPGLVDTHVHINDPGRSDWEGFTTATRAAAAGGVTTLVDMPLNSIPPTTTTAGLDAKLRALHERTHVDVALCGGLVPANPAGLPELFREGVVAFKCFLAESGVDEFSHVQESELRAGMRELAKIDAPLFVHAELPGPLAEGERAALGLDPRRYATYLASRPRRAEDAAVELVLRMAEETGARAHIVHLSSSDALPLFRRAREQGTRLTVETCPHYLTFASEEIPDGATELKCAPPIREGSNRDLLWHALREGLIDQVVTDHSPSTAELKCSGSGDFMKAWGGISSLQLGLAAVWTAARARGHGVADLVRWMSEGPARLAGLTGRKGAIAVGCDADLLVFDPDAEHTVDVATLEHRNKITPYHGRSLRGATLRTILRGHTIYERGQEFSSRRGAWVRR